MERDDRGEILRQVLVPAVGYPFQREHRACASRGGHLILRNHEVFLDILGKETCTQLILEAHRRE